MGRQRLVGRDEPAEVDDLADAGVRGGLQTEDRLLAEAVQASPAWKERDELLQSIPGLGPVTSLTLLAALPDED